MWAYPYFYISISIGLILFSSKATEKDTTNKEQANISAEKNELRGICFMEPK